MEALSGWLSIFFFFFPRYKFEFPHALTMKIVLDNKEELHDIEDRLQKAVDCVLESNSKLRSSERKLIRSQLTQLTSCLTLKVYSCTVPTRP